MKIVVILSIFFTFLFSSNDYIPLSQFELNKKYEYNFIEKKEKKQLNQKSSNFKINSEFSNKKVVNDYKKNYILKDTENLKLKKEENKLSFSPSLNYSYLTIEGNYPQKSTLVDYKNVLIPELILQYDNHIMKLESLNVQPYFRGISSQSDYDTKVNWYKLSYLYQYNNLSMGLAYNDYKNQWKYTLNAVENKYTLKESFPSLQLNLKNQKDNISLEYGFSYGKNSNIDYSYEYHMNFAYEMINFENIQLNAGYKSRVIDVDNLKFEYKGPIIGLKGKF